MPKPFPYLTVRRAAAELGISRGRLYVLLRRDPSLVIKDPDLGWLVSRQALAKLEQRTRTPGRRPKTA